MWIRMGAVILVVNFLSACRILPDRVDRFITQHDVLLQKDAKLLSGPYEMRRVAEPHLVVLVMAGKETPVRIRGCMPTGDAALDLKAARLLGTLHHRAVYIRNDCSTDVSFEPVRTIVYFAANQESWMDTNGTITSTILSYATPVLVNLAYGYCLLDHSDTNYPMYEIFLEAERLARKHKRGYWKTQPR